MQSAIKSHQNPTKKHQPRRALKKRCKNEFKFHRMMTNSTKKILFSIGAKKIWSQNQKTLLRGGVIFFVALRGGGEFLIKKSKKTDSILPAYNYILSRLFFNRIFCWLWQCWLQICRWCVCCVRNRFCDWRCDWLRT